MEDNKPEEHSSESSPENKESTQESNATETDTSQENKATEENDSEPQKKKWTIPSFKLNLSGIKNIYENHYKKLLILPITLLLIAILLIGFKLALTGEFIEKDVSLSGGATL